MKNTISNKVLLPLVLLIWIGVLYRVFWYEPTVEVISLPEKSDDIQVVDFKEADTLSLQLNYNDPFHLSKSRKKKKVFSSKSSKRGKTSPQTSRKKTPKIIPTSPKPIDWSRFSYKGFSQVSDQKQKTALLSIFGSTRFLGVGDSVSGVKVSMITRDSVGIVFKNKTRTLYRE